MDALSLEFAERAAAARGLHLSADVLSANARDMLRVAAFAGFDAKAVLVDCFKRSNRGALRVNVTTVERVMGEHAAADAEYQARRRRA